MFIIFILKMFLFYFNDFVKKMLEQPIYTHRELHITFPASLEKSFLVVLAPTRQRCAWLDLTWGQSPPGWLTASHTSPAWLLKALEFETQSRSLVLNW